MKTRSFTLIEILVALAVISIIAGFVFVYMRGAIDSGKDMKRKADIGVIKNALVQYRSEHYSIGPVQAISCQIGNNCTVLSSALTPFLSSFPQDPNGTYYTYQSTDGTDCTISAILSSGSSYSYSSLSGYETALVANWPMHEGAGSNVYDNVGTNTGTINGATWASNRLSFDGSNDYVTMGTTTFTTGETTITMWMKPTASQQNGLGDLKVGGSGLILYERTIGAGAERAMMGFRGLPEISTPANAITVGAWNFLTFVYNGGAKGSLSSFAIYANGMNQTPLEAQGAIGGSTTYNRIGSDQSSAFFNGLIDDVRIYNRALTQAEVTALYDIQKLTH